MFCPAPPSLAPILGLDFIGQQPNDISTFYAFGRKTSGTRHVAVPVHSPGFMSRWKILVWSGGVSGLAEVKLQEGETLENALRRFKRKVQQEDIIKEVKRHSFYLKPGEKLRAKQALARKRNRKKNRREIE